MINNLFDLKNKIVVVTGGSGFIGSEICCALAEIGCKVSLLYNKSEPDKIIIDRMDKSNSEYHFFRCDVLDKVSIENCKKDVLDAFGDIDILINCAGGNNPDSTTSDKLSFFDIPSDAFNLASQLNMMGTVLTCQIFGNIFAENKKGNILNISSIAALRPLTKIPAYSSSKAAINNFTKWLSVYMATEYSSKIRVNAIAPGFLLSKQNQFLLIDKETGNFTERGKKIIDHTPMKRFGEPQELISTIVWLLSPSSSFVSGVVVPVDGGFSAFSGV